MKGIFSPCKPSLPHAAAVFSLSLTLCLSNSLSVKSAYGAAGVDGTSGTHAVLIVDPAIHMTAFTVQVPDGWKFVGTILRPHGCHAPGLPADGLSYAAVAPDRVTATMQLPGASWSWASDGSSPMGPKCGSIDITSAAAFLLNIAVPMMHPTAKILEVVPLSAKMQQGIEAARRQMEANASGPGHMRSILDTQSVRIEYNLDGQIVQEQLGTVITCQVFDTPAYPQLRRPARTQRACLAHGIYVKRARKGALDQFVARQLPNAQFDREWDAEISRRMRQAFAAYQKASDEQFQAIQNHYRQVTANMVKRGQEFNDNLAESTRHAMAADRAQQAATDHAAHLQVLDSLNRQDFIDPTTGRKIETSNQYMHNWISSDRSEVLVNNDPTLDPNGLVDPVRESWTELIPVS